MLRSERVVLRVAPAEVEALKLIAKADHRNMSEAIRELIRAESRKRGEWPLVAQNGSHEVQHVAV